MLRFMKFPLVFVVLFAFCFCYGQDGATVVQHTIDSLDRVKPAAYKKVKPLGCTYVIKVTNQQEFNAINDEITKAIKAGKKNIQVRLEKGVYHFRQEHIRRINEHADVFISFIGENAVITSDKNYSSTGGKGSGWQEMRYADSIIQVMDEKKKLCLIPFSNKWSETEKKNLTKVQITQWFREKVYPIEEIDNKGIYFIASELAWENDYGHKGYNVNFDYLYLGKTPRFRVYDSARKPECTAARFLTIKDCSYRSLSFKGIEFRSTDASNILLHFTNVDANQIAFSDCQFYHIRGNGVAFFSGTGNVVFDGNGVCNTGGDELFFSSNCPNIRVTNNTFENCGQGLSGTFCVRCYEAEYYIAHNTFRDFGYGAIGVGVWHGFEKKYSSRGIIEHNEICFSPEYFSNAWQHMLMDSGAIYIWTQNDEVIIRYNYIHDYTGAGDNRGIFCDDCACNLKIYGNVVTNIPNSYCIDSRYCKDQHDGFTNNGNNFMAENIVDGSVRFMGYSCEQRHCRKGSNYVIREDGEKALENKFENLEVMDEDAVIGNVHEAKRIKTFRKFKIKIKK